MLSQSWVTKREEGEKKKVQGPTGQAANQAAYPS